MKKAVLFLFLLVLFYGRYERVDLNRYAKTTKHIEIKGEVNQPGIYEVERHATIQDVLQKAKGIRKQGDSSALNLSQDIPDQSVIHVPKKTTKTKISINGANAQQLQQLPGIGPAMAQRIIAYRNQKPFSSLTDIMKVKGIKEKLYAKIKDAI